MKLLIYADAHYSEQSSIIRSQGKKYSTRIENVIDTVNWLEEIAYNNDCKHVVMLGDFFDKSSLTAMEITALSEIKFEDTIFHSFVCGNHEMGNNDSSISSAKIFNLLQNSEVIDECGCIALDEANKVKVYVIPYILETNRKSLGEYLENSNNYKTVVLSHNDIRGINMGTFVTNTGFTIDEIEQASDLFINGHIHNQSWLNEDKTILNIGNITGQNFSEDAFKYPHQAVILDTKDLSLKFIENPYAFNFYKLDYSNVSIDSMFHALTNLKNNSIISLKINYKFTDTVKQFIDNLENIIEYRITSVGFNKSLLKEENTFSQETSDYLKQFTNFMMDNIEGNEDVIHELQEICK